MRWKSLLNIGHGLHDGGGDEGQVANAVAALNGAVNAVGIGAVIAELAEDCQQAAPEKTAAVEGDVFFVDPQGESRKAVRSDSCSG
jgi:hypothetical protein